MKKFMFEMLNPSPNASVLCINTYIHRSMCLGCHFSKDYVFFFLSKKCLSSLQTNYITERKVHTLSGGFCTFLKKI